MKSVTTALWVASFVCLSLLAACKGNRDASKKGRYMKSAYKEMRKDLKEAQVSISNDSVRVIFPNNLLFETNSDSVKAGFFPTIERFADILTKYEATRVLVVGHTDSIGGDGDYNLKLSNRRAASASRALSAKKIAKDRLETWGMSSKEPVATNATEEGRAKNRRVEFIILHNYKPE